MKKVIPITNTPNQSFSFLSNKYEVFVTILSVYDMLCANIRVEDTDVCNGVKCINGSSLLPPRVEKMINGKLYFETDGSYPSATTLGTDQCKLILETANE